MVERHVDKKQRIVKSEPASRSGKSPTMTSNKYIEEYNEFISEKKCYKRIISLINSTYQKMMAPEPNAASGIFEFKDGLKQTRV